MRLASLIPLQDELFLLCLIHPFATEWSLYAPRKKDRVFCFLKQSSHLQQHLLRHKDIKIALYAKIIIKFGFNNPNSIKQFIKFSNIKTKFAFLKTQQTKLFQLDEPFTTFHPNRPYLFSWKSSLKYWFQDTNTRHLQ